VTERQDKRAPDRADIKRLRARELL
jgi:hypothetical protein